MRKSYFLFFGYLFTPFVLLAQQVITTKGDKVDVSNMSVEPWMVGGTSTKAALNNQNIYQNGKIGINTGTTAIAAALDIINDSGNADATQYTTINDDIRVTTFTGNAAGTDYVPQLLLRRAQGTKVSPANLASGNSIGTINFVPYTSGGWAPENSTYIGADYLGDGTTNLTAFKFFTSNLQRMRIDEKGNMLLYGGDAYNNQSAVATENLDVVGNARVRNVPKNLFELSDRTPTTNYDANNQANRRVVMKEDGTFAYRFDYAPTVRFNGTTLNLSGIQPEALASMYLLDWSANFLGKTVNITLPNPANCTGREFTVYFYGGVSDPNGGGTLNFYGTIVGSTQTIGSYLTIVGGTRVTITGSGADFRRTFQYQKISLFSNGVGWTYIGPR